MIQILSRGFLLLRDILTAAMVLGPATVLGQTCVDYRDYVHVIGSTPIPSVGEAVTVDGPGAEVAYVCLGHDGIVAMDVASNVPAILDTLRTPGTAHAIALRDNVAWIAAGPAGILRLDISDPENLAFTGSYATKGEAWDIVLSGSVAMIAAWDAGFQLLDISDPQEPAWLGSSDLPGFGVGIAAAGASAYVTDFVGLKIIDCSNPMAPSVIGALGLTGKVNDVAVLGVRAYVAAGEAGLHVVDVSNPFLPSRVTTVTVDSDQLRHVVVNPTHAFATGYQSLHLFDLTDAPIWMGNLETMEELGVPAINDDRAFLVGAGRVDLMDIHPLEFPSVIGEFSDSSSLVDNVSILDQNISCATGNEGGAFFLRMFDVADAEHPAPRGEISTDGFVGDLVTADGHAYAAVDAGKGWASLSVFDCRDPDAPQRLAELPDGGGNLDIQDNYLYAGVSQLPNFSFNVIDISNPGAPEVRSQLMTERFGQFEVSGLYAYALSFVDELFIIDIADPEAPVMAKSFDLGRMSPRALTIEGTFVYVLGSAFFSGIELLLVLDISDPLSPVAVGDVELPTTTGSEEIAADMGMVYVSSGTNVYVVDARAPQDPIFMSATSWDFEVRSMAINDQGIHVGGYDRYAVLPLQCQGPQAVEVAAFDAVAEPGAIRITWRTALEEDHLGFHVERAMAEVGPFLRINRELIEPPGPYAHRDPDVRPGATYYYRLAALDRFGGLDLFGPRAATAIANDVTGGPPLRSALARSQPNPFTPASAQTAIRFTLAHPGPTTLRLYDPAGRLIQTLVDESLPAGEHLATWDGRNARGEAAAAGTYFYRLMAGDFTATHSLVRLR